MNPQILTLFGEEYAPQPVKPAGRSRAKKKSVQETAETEDEVAARAEDISVPVETAPASKEETGKGLAPADVTKPAPPQPALKKAKAPAARKAPAKKRIIERNENILKGWVPEKQYYTIGEVSRLFKVNTSHIRFWTNEFALKVRTTKKGDRLYTPDQIRELHTIYNLVKERGFTLAGAKIKLKEEKKGAADKQNLKQSLTKLKNQLTSLRKQLA